MSNLHNMCLSLKKKKKKPHTAPQGKKQTNKQKDSYNVDDNFIFNCTEQYY